jgi:hypothetical protein
MYSRRAWYALVGAALSPHDRETGFQSLKPSLSPAISKYNGATGTLNFQVTLKGESSATVWFAVAGSNVEKAEASGALVFGLAAPDELLRAKISGRQQVLSQTQIHVPDAAIQAAFDWGKLNLADMRRTVRDMMVRDTMEGTVYPSPLRPALPIVSGELDIRTIHGFSAPMAPIASFHWLPLGSGKKQKIIWRRFAGSRSW